MMNPWMCGRGTGRMVHLLAGRPRNRVPASYVSRKALTMVSPVTVRGGTELEEASTLRMSNVTIYKQAYLAGFFAHLAYCTFSVVACLIGNT